jgi:hypothetical protein
MMRGDLLVDRKRESNAHLRYCHHNNHNNHNNMPHHHQYRYRYYCIIIVITCLVFLVPLDVIAQQQPVQQQPVQQQPVQQQRQVLQVGVVYPWAKQFHAQRHWLLSTVMAGIDRPINISENIHPMRDWHPSMQHVNNSILVTFSSLAPYFDMLQQAEALTHVRLGIIHLGDADCTADTSFYDKAVFVYRNYYCEQVFAAHANIVRFLPLGYRNHPMLLSHVSHAASTRKAVVYRHSTAGLLPAPMRPMQYTFAGSTSPFRLALTTLLGNAESFNASNFDIALQSHKHMRQTASYYYAQLRNSVVALCPANNERGLSETSRIYEALVSAAVPLVCMLLFSSIGVRISGLLIGLTLDMDTMGLANH